MDLSSLLGKGIQVGDIFSAKSQASSNPVNTLVFTPTLEVISGSPDAYLKGDQGGISATPSISAPMGISQGSSPASSGLPGKYMAGGLTSPTTGLTGAASGSLFTSPLFMIALVGIALVVFMRRK